VKNKDVNFVILRNVNINYYDKILINNSGLEFELAILIRTPTVPHECWQDKTKLSITGMDINYNSH
jgi:hypothetical protein